MGSSSAIVGDVKTQRRYKITLGQEWRGKLGNETLGVRVVRYTAFVWVPLVGIGTVIVLKMLVGVLIRFVIAAFT
jgi:hypothetical protein